jgi:hypothetical protein
VNGARGLITTEDQAAVGSQPVSPDVCPGLALPVVDRGCLRHLVADTPEPEVSGRCRLCNGGVDDDGIDAGGHATLACHLKRAFGVCGYRGPSIGAVGTAGIDDAAGLDGVEALPRFLDRVQETGMNA